MGCEQDCPPPSSAVRATVRRRSAEEVSGRATAPAQILSMTVKAARQARRHGKQGSISTRVPNPLPAAVPAAVERRSADEVSGRALSPARHPLNERRAGSSSRQRRRTTWSAALRREDTISRTTCRALRHGIPSPKERHELVQPATIARRQRRIEAPWLHPSRFGSRSSKPSSQGLPPPWADGFHTSHRSGRRVGRQVACYLMHPTPSSEKETRYPDWRSIK